MKPNRNFGIIYVNYLNETIENSFKNYGVIVRGLLLLFASCLESIQCSWMNCYCMVCNCWGNGESVKQFLMSTEFEKCVFKRHFIDQHIIRRAFGASYWFFVFFFFILLSIKCPKQMHKILVVTWTGNFLCCFVTVVQVKK